MDFKNLWGIHEIYFACDVGPRFNFGVFGY